MEYIFMALLGMCTIHDLRSKKIPGILIWICMGLSCGYRGYSLFTGNAGMEECIMAVIPGIALLVFSYSSKQIGCGDGLLIVAAGLFWGGEGIMEILAVAFLLAAVFAIAYLLIKRGSKDHRIPFIPFLFIAVLFWFGGGI